ELARRAAGHTNPNPMVGAVIVKDGRIIGEGYHRRIGELHAERNALAGCTESAEGATIYVTLEPCCHYGKTPPCTEAILEHKLAKVVIGSRDPNPKVAGKGAAMLREAGVEVVEDFLREECDALNPVFFQYIREKQPYVAMKYAMTADGKIAADSGDSKWITGEAARAHVQELRNYYKGIMVGIGTVLADDPSLTCRMPQPVSDDYGEERNASGYYGRNPVRIVCDSHLQIPLESKLCNTVDQAPVIVACLKEEDYVRDCMWKETEYFASSDSDSAKLRMVTNVNRDVDSKTVSLLSEDLLRQSYRLRLQELQEKGVQILTVEEKQGHIDLRCLLTELGKLEIDGILVEGGGSLNSTLIREGLVHHIYAYIGAQIFGGVNGYTPVSGTGIQKVSESLKLTAPNVKIFGDDVLLEYDIKKE
ncbi:MAG: bifunctional diaminohydroxyphosphoribosylaminopyrimidine deaminase/5-amino-6-(5-phosphoribosylamino)uracil reductase RibD, partial [Lachnospiraceae bacterium]|nr:bifunctional diaminohydroxyphosphoribosylaminopyrimidine deaminase/5-amino-6-(5-phosphoribosylamino)uracil reductase RibD [Lachnospiraceae bacterium]